MFDQKILLKQVKNLLFLFLFLLYFIYMNKLDVKYKLALDFIKKMHRGQTRAGNVPVWHHLARVSLLLQFLLNKNREGSLRERFDIGIAGLGHDLIEDTKVIEREVKKIFTEHSLKLVKDMTNAWGDNHSMSYVRKIVRSEEGARLIKLSDLYDNLTNVTYNFNLLGLKWVVSYFLPIVLPMKKAVIKTRFNKYKKTASDLIILVNSAEEILLKEINFYRKKS